MSGRVIVVGAGPAGLGAAAALATTHAVVVVERAAAVGGASTPQHPEVRALERQARTLGVRFRLGATACRWLDRRLLVASPDGIAWLAGERIFVAAGLRPATAAELGLYGDRPAGVLPATAAAHMLATRQALWRAPVVVGSGCWAEDAAREVRAAGGASTVVARAEHPAPAWADRWWPGCRPRRVVGDVRVRALIVARADQEIELACDAVLLGDDPRPVRNVAGAVLPGAAAVTYVQPAAVGGAVAAAAAGAAIARAWVAANA